jgi:catechol 2,3-dioxygenase-like lactoylglutathione lyase family enzyme
MSSVEQRLSLVTLGVGDLERARRFYEALGWTTDAAAATTSSSSRPAE